MSIPPTINFKNFLEVDRPRETLHAQDLFGMIGMSNDNQTTNTPL